MISWAIPATNWPRAASFSAWASRVRSCDLFGHVADEFFQHQNPFDRDRQLPSEVEPPIRRTAKRRRFAPLPRSPACPSARRQPRSGITRHWASPLPVSSGALNRSPLATIDGSSIDTLDNDPGSRGSEDAVSVRTRARRSCIQTEQRRVPKVELTSRASDSRAPASAEPRRDATRKHQQRLLEPLAERQLPGQAFYVLGIHRGRRILRC